jgi:hypothetical protein
VITKFTRLADQADPDDPRLSANGVVDQFRSAFSLPGAQERARTAETSVEQLTPIEEIMKRFVHVIVAGALITGATGSAAFANPTDEPYYPVEQDGAEVSSDVVAPGDAVTVSFGGFKPYSIVTISLEQISGGTALGSSIGPIMLSSSSAKTVTEKADGEGVVTLDLTLPTGGTYSVRAAGIDPSGAPRALSTEVVAAVSDAGSSISAGEPGEGSSAALALALGAGFVVTAAGAAIVVRRGSRKPQAS